FLPTPNLAFQVSAGHLREAEAAEGTAARLDVNKATASATYNRVWGQNVWASTVAWGRNSELDHASNALLAETAVTRADRDSWYGRFEIDGKTAHDLDVATGVLRCVSCTDVEIFTVTKLQGGYTHYVEAGAFRPGVGFTASAGFVPEALRAAYGSRVRTGIGVYLTMRPRMVSTQASGGARAMVMVRTAFDPVRLTCPAGF